MGRSPCCEKVGLKKGPWTPEEDQKLLAYVEEHGHGSWRALPTKAGLQRCGKSCRLRWTNYLRPDIKRGKFSLQEEQTIIQLHALLGNRWSAIATHLPKRTDNEIKNYWNTHLKKRLAKMGIDPLTHKPKSDALSSADGLIKKAANLSHMAQWESARLEAEARLARESKLRSSTSTSFQSQLVSASASGSGSSSSAPSQQDNKTPLSAPPLCLDVLNAWSGVWSKSTKGSGNGILGRHLESPTSTLSSSENTLPILTVGHGETETTATMEFAGNSALRTREETKEAREDDWKSFGKPTCPLGFKVRMENSMDFPTTDFHEMVFAGEGSWALEPSKTDNGPGPVSNFIDGFTELLLDNSDELVSSDGGNSEEENENYWNNILNLVNTSPSHSKVL